MLAVSATRLIGDNVILFPDRLCPGSTITAISGRDSLLYVEHPRDIITSRPVPHGRLTLKGHIILPHPIVTGQMENCSKTGRERIRNRLALYSRMKLADLNLQQNHKVMGAMRVRGPTRCA